MPKKTQARRQNERALSPGEVIALCALWKHERKHSHRGCLVNELAAAFDDLSPPSDPAVALARKYINSLANRHPPYVKAEYAAVSHRSKQSQGPEYDKHKAPVRYRTLTDTFVQWPRTAVFLLCLFVSKPDNNGIVSKKEFRERLRSEFGFSDSEFQSDFDFTVRAPEPETPRPEPNYVREYPLDSGIRLRERIHLEMQYLLTIAAESSVPNIEKLIDDVRSRLL